MLSIDLLFRYLGLLTVFLYSTLFVSGSTEPFEIRKASLRKIIHIDMDCYFAAVEMRDFPEYRGRPLAVGGSSDRRGVISTCNYEARKFGVRSAMASAYALKLCPDLLLIPGRMSVYKEVSAEIRAIFARYTSLIEPLSLDEAYLDVSDSSLYQGSATLFAVAIRADILA